MAAKKKTIKGTNRNYIGSDSAKIVDVIKVYGNGNTVKARNGKDQITVYQGKKHKIYGDAGVDTIKVLGGTSNYIYGGASGDKITVSGGSSQKIDGGTGNDTITVSGGNKHTLRGGKGSDKYVVSSAIAKATRLTVNQNDIASGDADTLNLKKVKRADVAFSYNSSKNTLTMKHRTGGAIAVTNWTKNPLSKVLFANKETYHVIAGNKSKKLSGTKEDDYILAVSANTTVKAGAGNDTIIVSSGSKSSISGGSGKDTITVTSGTSLNIQGDSAADVIRIKGGSGHTIDGGTGNDKVYVDKGAVKTIYNGGGNDYIEIGKNAGNLIQITSGNGNGKLVANETVKVLGGSKHDICLYGGDDKVIVAGGFGHVIYTDGPTGTGDAGGNDTIVIQDGGTAKKIVAGNGNDVIAVANGAGDGTTIYTGLEDPNGKNSGTGHNTLNLLGGSGHTVYLGGEKNIVMVEAQNVTLNKYAGTDDDITVRWSEEGTGTLRINCPTGISSEQNSMLRLEGVNSVDFKYELKSLEVKTGNAYDGITSNNSLVMTFTGIYFRDTDGYVGNGVYQAGDTANSRVAVYVNDTGLTQYNWCAGNWQHNYISTPVAASDMKSSAVIEIARWGSFKGFVGIQFDDKVKSFAEINDVAGSTHTFPSYG